MYVTLADLLQYSLVLIGIITLVVQIIKKEVTAQLPTRGYF